MGELYGTSIKLSNKWGQQWYGCEGFTFGAGTGFWREEGRVDRYLINLNLCRVKPEYHRFFSIAVFFYLLENYIFSHSQHWIHTQLFLNEAKCHLPLDLCLRDIFCFFHTVFLAHRTGFSGAMGGSGQTSSFHVNAKSDGVHEEIKADIWGL